MNEWKIVNNARRYRNSCTFFELRILLSYPSVFIHMKLDHKRFARFVKIAQFMKNGSNPLFQVYILLRLKNL